MNTITTQKDREVLSPAQRWLEVSFDVPMLLLLGFFADHQLTRTGFLTARFGPLEMAALYGPILVALVAPVVRALTGRRNPARPFDVAMYLCLSAGSLWLLVVFPLDFAHLVDVLPGAARLILGWISDDVGKAVMLLQVILGPISSLFAITTYRSMRRHEPRT